MSQWKVHKSNLVYFVTTSIVGWQPVFTAASYFEILIDGLKFCTANKGLHLHGYVIMPNHAHYILSTDENIGLSDVMRDFKTHTSRMITERLALDRKTETLAEFEKAAHKAKRGSRFKVWQDGFHPIAIRSQLFFNQKLNYIHYNPVEKKFVKEPEEWIYSSARNYLFEDHSIIEVECLM